LKAPAHPVGVAAHRYDLESELIDALVEVEQVAEKRIPGCGHPLWGLRENGVIDRLIEMPDQDGCQITHTGPEVNPGLAQANAVAFEHRRNRTSGEGTPTQSEKAVVDPLVARALGEPFFQSILCKGKITPGRDETEARNSELVQVHRPINVTWPLEDCHAIV
jgi:hypothetical protein